MTNVFDSSRLSAKKKLSKNRFVEKSSSRKGFALDLNEVELSIRGKVESVEIDGLAQDSLKPRFDTRLTG